VLREGIIMHSDYSGEHKKIQEFGKNCRLLGSTRKSFIGRKKLLQFLWQQVCYGLIGSAKGKNACMFASVVGDVVA
jgi:hypothetical protein